MALLPGIWQPSKEVFFFILFTLLSGGDIYNTIPPSGQDEEVWSQLLSWLMRLSMKKQLPSAAFCCAAWIKVDFGRA